MPEEKVTPEEKLLRLIENPAQAKDAGLKPKKIKLKFKFNIFGAVKSFLKTKDKFSPRIFNLGFLNQCLVVLSALIAVFLIFDFIKGRPNLDKIYAYTSGIEEGAVKIKTAAEVKAVEISDYVSQIERRDIFHSIPLKKEEKIPEAKELLAVFAQDLKLVGIIWSVKPQAMIESKKENRTMLLNAGDFIGKVKIKQILKDKVILGYDNEETELL